MTTYLNLNARRSRRHYFGRSKITSNIQFAMTNSLTSLMRGSNQHCNTSMGKARPCALLSPSGSLLMVILAGILAPVAAFAPLPVCGTGVLRVPGTCRFQHQAENRAAQHLRMALDLHDETNFIGNRVRRSQLSQDGAEKTPSLLQKMLLYIAAPYILAALARSLAMFATVSLRRLVVHVTMAMGLLWSSPAMGYSGSATLAGEGQATGGMMAFLKGDISISGCRTWWHPVYRGRVMQAVSMASGVWLMRHALVAYQSSEHGKE